ncbi:hypothetical protein AiwAL_18490 [Acidiphilium sp. AL]|uniref:hypothetical protein n=1 Tax=Acidiphilium sp. AL TaxID=2871704 RepID=UPI0021CAE650|nr:hypothetical protein [Acidiphilium sp. AL]MCU4162049.1 hypothetical protein [Acidiphilium sp. AL]
MDQIVAASGGVTTIGPDIATALRRLAEDGEAKRVMICGSLYLAGVILARAQAFASVSG